MSLKLAFMGLTNKIISYCKSNTLHLIIFAIVVVLGASQVLQYAMTWRNANEIIRLDNSFFKYAQIAKATRTSDYTNIENMINTASARIDEDLNSFRLAVSARIDTIDSAIKPDEKRRAIIKLVRDAINENSNIPIDIRTLNSIAIAVIDNSYLYNLPIANTLAQMKQESGFNHRAMSKAKAKGLMQIIDSTADDIARELGKKRYNIWDISTNVEFGCYYMAKMLHVNNNNWDDAYRSYNFGPHNVVRVKAGEVDFSRSVVGVVEGVERKFLIDKYGNFVLDDLGQEVDVREEHKYPIETRLYVKRIRENIDVFAKYGLDKVE